MSVRGMDASPLADRVAARAVQGEYSPDDAIVLGCVGALSAADAFLPGGLLYAEADAASLLVLTAGALWARGAPLADTPGATRALADLARRTLDKHGTRVLSVTESLLAPVDPEGTWALIEHVVGGPAAVDSALGLDVAAHLELDRGELWRPPLPCPAPFTAQLVTDRIARAVIAGTVPIPTARGHRRSCLKASCGPPHRPAPRYSSWLPPLPFRRGHCHWSTTSCSASLPLTSAMLLAGGRPARARGTRGRGLRSRPPQDVRRRAVRLGRRRRRRAGHPTRRGGDPGQ